MPKNLPLDATPWQIRPMRERDLPTIAALEHVCFSDPWSESSFEVLLSVPAVYHCFVICPADGDDIAGYAIVNVFPPDDGELMNIAVAPAYRKRGAGQALLDACVAVCTENGAAALHLEVRATNASARALYEKNGFVADGVRAGYYINPREDAVLMSKRLVPSL